MYKNVEMYEHIQSDTLNEQCSGKCYMRLKKKIGDLENMEMRRKEFGNYV